MKASEGMRLLAERTGGPKVTATVTVDQIYAMYQHEGLEFRHPRGGRAKYVELPLYEHADEWVGDFAQGLLLIEEETAGHRWAGTGRSLVGEVSREAPLELGNLRRSGGLVVTEGVSVIVEEPPLQRRLTDEELQTQKALARMRADF